MGGVIVVLVGVLVLSQNGIGITAQEPGLRTGYACWGGCYNECILLNGKNPSERLPCYLQCLGNCIASSPADYQYNYCQLGCSLEKCVRVSSDGRKQESCLENCSSKVCNSNT
ncbi:hypothetical protein Vadar_017021 [Vaccinium darrowii]|uniref:Uncharacterized protein n=1 Tax=Vaccinium darrowii TaxID=229202 RepID=A0ACB7XIF8_9ERIC|nr:hypothetical protein Vadar_017021 [Vaccinium darrowii]